MTGFVPQVRIPGENDQHSEVIAAAGACKSTVDATIMRASATGLSWPLPVDFDDEALERRYYPPAVHKLPQPDWQALLDALANNKNKACRKAAPGTQSVPTCPRSIGSTNRRTAAAGNRCNTSSESGTQPKRFSGH